MKSQVWKIHIEKFRRRKPRSFLYCTIISSKKLSSSLPATSICARRRYALCRRFDPCTPKSTKPVILLDGIISIAVLGTDELPSFSESVSSSNWSDRSLFEMAGDEWSTDTSPELRLVLVLRLDFFSNVDSDFFLLAGVNTVTALLSTVQCACPETFES